MLAGESVRLVAGDDDSSGFFRRCCWNGFRLEVFETCWGCYGLFTLAFMC